MDHSTKTLPTQALANIATDWEMTSEQIAEAVQEIRDMCGMPGAGYGRSTYKIAEADWDSGPDWKAWSKWGNSPTFDQWEDWDKYS